LKRDVSEKSLKILKFSKIFIKISTIFSKKLKIFRIFNKFPNFPPQIKGLHTFIRNANTSRDEFIFYSNRLIRLVIEYALSLFPFKDVAIDTPQGITYSGKRMASNRICGVSILRAGETMEQAVSEVCKNIRIGKILIQTNQMTGEPEVSLRR
jgi:uracil phosphoribosyltransferase